MHVHTHASRATILLVKSQEGHWAWQKYSANSLQSFVEWLLKQVWRRDCATSPMYSLFSPCYCNTGVIMWRPSSCEERVQRDSRRTREICLTEQWHGVLEHRSTDARHWILCTLPSRHTHNTFRQLEKYIPPVPTYYAAIRLQLHNANPNTNHDL